MTKMLNLCGNCERSQNELSYDEIIITNHNPISPTVLCTTCIQEYATANVRELRNRNLIHPLKSISSEDLYEPKEDIRKDFKDNKTLY